MLTDLAVRTAKPREKLYKIWDSGGMYVLVTPRGSRCWRLKYRIDGREKSLSLGVYPRVSLALARERREKAKDLLEAGIDPSEQRKAEKRSRSETFESVAREWLAMQGKVDAKHKQAALSKRTLDRALDMFERLILPYLGRRPIAKITVPELLQVLKRIEATGHHDTCHRAKQKCGQVFLAVCGQDIFILAAFDRFRHHHAWWHVTSGELRKCEERLVLERWCVGLIDLNKRFIPQLRYPEDFKRDAPPS